MMSTPATHRYGNIALLVSLILIWGVTWPVLKVGLHYAPPIWLAALRFVLAALCFFVVLGLRGQLRFPPRQDWPIVLSIGLAQMLGFALLINLALQYIPPGRSAVMAYTTPLWVTPAAALLLGERLTFRKILAVVLGILGLVAIVNPLQFDWSHSDVLKGYLMLMGASLAWAICIVHIRAHRWQSSALDLIPWQLGLAAVMLTAVALFFEGPVPGDGSAGFWAVTLFLSVLATAFAQWAVITLNSRLPASTLSIMILATPAVGLLASVLVLGEPLDTGLIIGIVAIFTGVLLVSKPAQA